MPAGRYSLTMEQGADFNRVLTWYSGGSPVNLASYTARMQIRTPDYASVIASYASPSAIVLGTAGGTITFNVPAASNASLPYTAVGELIYDLELVSAGGVVTRLLQGRFTIMREVTL